MKKKFLLLLSVMMIALLAFSLAACDNISEYNKKSTVTVNVTRSATAKDCVIEATTSCGELTQSGDTITVALESAKEFAITLTAARFKTTTINVALADYNDGKAEYNVAFGDTVPQNYELSLQGHYDGLSVTCDSDTVVSELKDSQILIHNSDMYTDPIITISANGYEPMILPLSDIANLPTIKLVSIGNMQVIYRNSYSTIRYLKDDFHNIYSSQNIGNMAFFELPKYDGYYQDINHYSDSALIKTDKVYGTMIGFSNNYNNNDSIKKINQSLYNFLVNHDTFSLDKDGNILDWSRIDSYNYSEGIEHYINYNRDADRIISFNDDDSVIQYAIINIHDLSNISGNDIVYNDIDMYTTLTNEINNEIISDFMSSYTEWIDDNYVTHEISAIDGKINFPRNTQDMTFYFEYNGDEYDDYKNFSYIKNLLTGATFIDGKLTLNTFVSPSIILQLQVADKGILLDGAPLASMGYIDGYYNPTQPWKMSGKYVYIDYANNNNYNKSNYIIVDISLLERVGNMTYRYNKVLNINNNNCYNITLKHNGSVIQEQLLGKLPVIDHTYIQLSYNGLIVETSLKAVTFSLTYDGKRYTITLDPTYADGKEYIYELNNESK